MTSHKRVIAAVAVATAALIALAGCGSSSSGAQSSAPSTTAGTGAGSAPAPAQSSQTGTADAVASGNCAPGSLPLKQSGVFNVHADKPLYAPWFIDNDPTNGKGFESSLMYLITERMGLKKDQLEWGYTAFTVSFAPGPKDFDAYVTEVSITPQREKVVSFSEPYYKTPLVVMAKKGSPITKAKSMEDLKKYTFGTLVGSVYSDYIMNTIKPASKPMIFNTNTDSSQALQNGQVDATLQTLQIGQNIVANQFKDFTLVGILPDGGSDLGIVFGKDSKLVPCVNKALDSLKADGSLTKLQDEWLKPTQELPTFTK